MNPYDSEDIWPDEAPTNPRRGVGVARVLVAEDDAELRGLVSSMLLDEGFAVDEAKSGTDMLRICHASGADAPSDAIDLLVVDHRMPGCTGLEALEQLRMQRWDTPAILMTSFPEARVIETATRLGVTVLAKPFPAEVLTRTVIAMLLRSSQDGALAGSTWKLSADPGRRG